MLIAVIFVLFLVGLFVLTSSRRALSSTRKLGWMSDQWLAEYRASHT